MRFFPPSIFSTAFQRLHLAGNFEYEFLSSGVAPLFWESFPTTTVGTVVRPWPEFRVFTKEQDFAKGPKIKDFAKVSKFPCKWLAFLFRKALDYRQIFRRLVNLGPS